MSFAVLRRHLCGYCGMYAAENAELIHEQFIVSLGQI